MKSRKIRIKDNNYYEKHHIIPEALGGPDVAENIVYLLGKEHFIAHWLLIKMVKEPAHKRSMQFAFWQMARGGNKYQKRKITSKQYEIAKKHVAEANRKLNIGRKYKINPETEIERRRKIGNAHRGKTVIISEETKAKISKAMKGENNPFFGKTHSPEFIEAHKERMKTRKISDETRDKLSKAMSGESHPMFGKRGPETGFYGKNHSEETKVKMRKPKSEETKAKMRKPKEKVICPHCLKEGGINGMKRYHFDNCLSSKKHTTASGN